MMNILIFSIDKKRYALDTKKVVRVLWALEITLMPEKIDSILGIFDLHGKIIPLISLRKLLSFPHKKIGVDDVFIVIDLHGHQMALCCDEIIGTMELKIEDSTEIDALFPELYVSEVVKYDNRLIPVLNMDRFLEYELASQIMKKVTS